jgi:TolA-binding protein
MPLKDRIVGIPLFSLLLVVGCAYFNTFYNAEQYFIKAEQARLESVGDRLPPTAIDAYGKVIEKTSVVLEKYPDSKYRTRALLLMGVSRYHRKEYRLAESTMRQLAQEGNPEEQLEARYWLALCKWKTGKPQPALNDLKQLLQEEPADDFRSRVYLSMAEIFLELNDDQKALSHLEQAAGSTRERAEKGQIYYRLAQLAFEREDYPRAIMAYRNVMKNVTSKKWIEEANLQIVRGYRLMGDLKTASRRIKTMLLDETFKAIHGDLELELAMMYFTREQYDKAVNRLESITQDYPRTKISAEAYFRLGEYALNHEWDLETAKKHFSQVIREFRTSPYTPEAQTRIKEIDAYLDATKQLSNFEQELQSALSNPTPVDTTLSDTVEQILVDIPTLQENLAGQLYKLSELEAFHFQRPALALDHLQTIIEQYQATELYPKALFTAAYLLEELGDSTQAGIYQEEILTRFPKSDYADYLRKVQGRAVMAGASAERLRAAERMWLVNRTEALNAYRSIVSTDSTSESSARAAYFLAYQFDTTYNQPDSALKYYEWLQQYHPDSEQALAARERLTAIRSFLEQIAVDTTRPENDY